MFREVPVLPVVVPLAGVVLAVLLRRLQRRGSLTVPRAAVALGTCVYAAGVVANTVFPIYLDKPARDARWHDAINVELLADYEVADAVMNVAVFVPVGALVALLAPRLSSVRALAVAAAFSLGIEVSQAVTAHALAGGHVADVHDLASNVAGAALGLLVLAAVRQVPVGARLVARLRWG